MNTKEKECIDTELGTVQQLGIGEGQVTTKRFQRAQTDREWQTHPHMLFTNRTLLLLCKNSMKPSPNCFPPKHQASEVMRGSWKTLKVTIEHWENTDNTYYGVSSPIHVIKGAFLLDIKVFSATGVIIYAMTMSELFLPRKGEHERPIVLVWWEGG